MTRGQETIGSQRVYFEWERRSGRGGGGGGGVGCISVYINIPRLTIICSWFSRTVNRLPAQYGSEQPRIETEPLGHMLVHLLVP